MMVPPCWYHSVRTVPGTGTNSLQTDHALGKRERNFFLAQQKILARTFFPIVLLQKDLCNVSSDSEVMASNNSRMVSSFQQKDDDKAYKDKLRPSESAETSSKYPTAEESVDEGTSLGGLNVEARSSAIVEPTNGLEEQVLKSKQQIDLQDEPRPNQTTPVTVDQELHEEGNGHVEQTERHSSLPGSPEQVAAHSVSTGRSLIVTPSPKRSAIDPATRGAFGVQQDAVKFEEIASDDSVAECITDVSNDEKNWQTLPAMIDARGRFGSAVVGGKVYVFGGSNSSGRLSTAEVYDPTLKSWSLLPRMRFAHSGLSCAAIGDNIYIIGGAYGPTKRNSVSVEIYNIVTGTYRQGVPMEIGRERHCSVSIGRKIYVFGGMNTTVTDKTIVFDEATQIWSNLAPMNNKRVGFSALSHDGNIYAMGGMKDGHKRDDYSRFLNTMEVYDVKKNEWKVSKEMKNRRYGCSSFLVGSKITVLGGCADKDFVQAVETFDIKENRWKQSLLPSSGSDRKEFASFVEGSKLIIVGGNNNINFGRNESSIDSVECFDNAAELIACTDVLDINVPEENQSSNLDARKNKKSSNLDARKNKMKNRSRRNRMIDIIKMEDDAEPTVPTRLRPKEHTKQSSNGSKRTQKSSLKKKGEKRAQETPEATVRPKKKARQSSNTSQMPKKPPMKMAKKGKVHKKQARQLSNQKPHSEGTKQLSKTSKRKQKSPMKQGKVATKKSAQTPTSPLLGNEMIEMKKRMEAVKKATIDMEEEWFGSAKDGPLCNRIDELKARFSS